MSKRLLVATRFSVPVRRRHQRAGARLSAQPGRPAGARRQRRVQRAAGGVNPFAPKPPHFASRQGRHLALHDRRRQPGGHVRPQAGAGQVRGPAADGQASRVRQGYPGPIMPSPFKFKKYGQSGMDVSELFPQHRHEGRRDRVPALGLREVQRPRAGALRDADRSDPHGFPSMGSGSPTASGSESSSLPGFVVLHDARGGPLGGPNNWKSGFLPAAYQGTPFRSAGDPIVDLKPPAGVTPEQQRARLDMLAKLNEHAHGAHPGSSELAARIASYELAYRMQGCAPEAVDIASESDATKKLYGLDEKVTEPFGRQCLMARRLVERGVRFVQLFSRRAGQPEYRHLGRPRGRQRRTTRSTPRKPTCRSPAC